MTGMGGDMFIIDDPIKPVDARRRSLDHPSGPMEHRRDR
jgi:hypothetical protein